MMKKIVVFVLFGLIVNSVVFANDVSVEAYDEQQNNLSYLALRIRLRNNTQDTLWNVKLQYFLPYDSARVLQIQEFFMGESHQKAVFSLDTTKNTIVLNVNIAAMAPGFYPNQGGLSFGLDYVDGFDFKKKASVCYPDTNMFSNTEKMPVFVNRHLVMGMVNASPMALIDDSEIYLFPKQKVTFSWHPLLGAQKYRLSVYNSADTSLIYREITGRTSSRVFLKQGNYLWNVGASSNGFPYQEWTYFEHNHLSIKELNVNDNRLKPIADLHMTPLAPRKDSPMLDVKWGELLDSMEWDRPHDTSAYIDSEDNQLKFRDSLHQNWDNSEGWRCWASATILINHYYGGNATQDELVFWKNRLNRDSILHAFLHGEKGAGGFYPEWAWGTTEYENNQINLSSKHLTSTLLRNVPVATCVKGHCMVIDACMYFENYGKRDTLCRFINVDNNGTYVWMNWATFSDYTSGGYYILKEESTPNPRMSDTLIINPITGKWRDSDRDGILDFDEVYRFKTNPYKKDSDGDGIDDKVEIWSYTRLEPYDLTVGVLRESFADVDGDNMRAELDSNSDNDALNDGLEDLNHNGLQDESERSPYYDDDENTLFSVPDYFGIYALNRLVINDGAKCFEGMDSTSAKYCNVAAAANMGLQEDVTVTIGAKAVVGNVFSRGDYFLRSYSKIDTLYTTERFDKIEYANPEKTEVRIVRIQDGAVYKSKKLYAENLWKSKWPIAMFVNVFKTPSKSVVVKAGDSLTLKDCDSYNLVRVESMGTLVINPGEYWIGEIQMHSGSQVLFAQPGKASVLHVNGNVYWHPTILNTNFFKLAKGFKMIHHGSTEMYVEGPFVGTIVAPKSNVVLGQSEKTFHGSILGKNITLHQHSKYFHIPYKPE